MKERMDVLVDFSNVAWACFYAAVGGFRQPDPAQVDQIIEETKKNLAIKLAHLSSIFRVPVDRFVFVADSRDEEKYQLFPEYKAGRQKPETDPRPLLRSWLFATYGVTFAESPCREADDVIATLVVQNYSTNQHLGVVVVSGDRDLWQLLQWDNVYIWDVNKKEFVNRAKIEAAFGVRDPRQITLVKILWGDRSDNVPNVAPRLQKSLMPIIQRTDGTLRDFWQQAQGTRLSPKACTTLFQNRGRMVVNEKLVTLKTNCNVVFHTK